MQLEPRRPPFDFLLTLFVFVPNVETPLFPTNPSGDLMEYVLSCFGGFFCLPLLFYLEQERQATDL